MSFLQRFFSLTALALRRIVNQPALSLCLLVGATLAVGLVVAVPSYVNAAQARALQKRLSDTIEAQTGRKDMSKQFSVRFSHIDFGSTPLKLEDYKKFDAFVRTRGATNLVLPTKSIQRYFSSRNYRTFEADTVRYDEETTTSQELFYASFGVLPNIENLIVMDEGEMPRATDASQPIEALVVRSTANYYGIRSGDVFTLELTIQKEAFTDANEKIIRDEIRPVRVRVSGIFQPKDIRSDQWALDPNVLRETFVINENAYIERLLPLNPNVTTLAIWNVQLDPTHLTIDDVPTILRRTEALKLEAFQFSKNFTLDSPAITGLRSFDKAARESLFALTLFAMPAVAMALYFLAMIASMATQQQEREIAILRSRGASTLNVFLLSAIQGLLIATIALVLGTFLGMLLAALMVNSRSFLDFGSPTSAALATFNFSPSVSRVAVIAACVSAIVMILPAIQIARRNVLQLGAERARNLRAPFWQRAFLDVLLLIVCVYGYFQLQQRGSFATIAQDLESVGEIGKTVAQLTAADDPFKDPVRFLLPVLSITALGLFAVRLLPRVIGLFARALEATHANRGVLLPLFFAMRELARSPHAYIAPLVLLIFTLGVAMFGASAARTLDRHLFDATYLRVGADARIVENGESNKPKSFGPFGEALPDDGSPELFSFMPVEDHLKINGVKDFARAVTLNVDPVALRRGDNNQPGKLLAIDRMRFQRIARSAFREDYANRQFDVLMNALGSSRDGLLASGEFLAANDLGIGDKLAMRFHFDQQTQIVTFTVKGWFELFPIIGLGDAKQVFVTHLDYTFDGIGKEVPYDVLVKLDDSAGGKEVGVAASEQRFLVEDVLDAREMIREEQLRPERQGMFGMLSATFIFITSLTVVGFAIYALLSFRRRAIEIGVMRSMGFSVGQMTLYVVFLQGLIVLIGAGIGAGLGLLVSRLFVPFLQFGGTLIQSVPPFVTRMAWQDAALLNLAVAFALFVVLSGSLIFLRRLRLFEVVKLGGTT
jgi:putative ABC transport system permease protein